MRALFASFVFVLLLGCGTGAPKQSDELLPDSAPPADTNAETAVALEDTNGLTPDTPIDTAGGGPKPELAVYGHSSTNLYRLDPVSLKLTNLGTFDGADGSMTDIALDKDGVMYGITFSSVYRIDYKKSPKSLPKCTHLALLTNTFNGLTMVPQGMIDSAKEVLVGVAIDGGWWRIDPSGVTAKLTQLGSYGGGWMSSGDAVGIIGDKVYATVFRSVAGEHDHVVTVNPKTGAVIKDIGDTGVDGFWGVGYWGGIMYGFTSNGTIYKIDLKTAKATEIPVKDKPSGGWWGAGVVTNAPTVFK
jgi:hypothetical protein